MDSLLPEAVLARVAQHLTLQQRARAACACSAWRSAAAAEGAHLLQAARNDDCGASCQAVALLHLGLGPIVDQGLAAVSPLVRLALSAALKCQPMTHMLLAATTRLRALSLEAAVGSSAGLLATQHLPPTLTHFEMTLGPEGYSASAGSAASTADAWTPEALAALAAGLTSGAPQLSALVLRCSSPAFFEEGGRALEAIAGLSALTALSLGPAPPAPPPAVAAAPTPHAYAAAAGASAAAAAPCPLGFAGPPPLLARLPRLRRAELHLADSASALIEAQTFESVAHLDDVSLVLRADTGPRVVGALPPRLEQLALRHVVVTACAATQRRCVAIAWMCMYACVCLWMCVWLCACVHEGSCMCVLCMQLGASTCR